VDRDSVRLSHRENFRIIFLNPDIIAAEIVEDLEAGLQQFAAIANDVKS
jgi:hypothetical protein